MTRPAHIVPSLKDRVVTLRTLYDFSSAAFYKIFCDPLDAHEVLELQVTIADTYIASNACQLSMGVVGAAADMLVNYSLGAAAIAAGTTVTIANTSTGSDRVISAGGILRVGHGSSVAGQTGTAWLTVVLRPVDDIYESPHPNYP